MGRDPYITDGTAARGRRGDMTRRGVILPVILFMLILLGLLTAGFAFRIHADVTSARATAFRLQCRLAAEAGIERVKLMLRDGRLDMNAWYDDPDAFNRIIVWTPDMDPTTLGTNEELDDGTPAYRFSIVADDPTDDEDFARFGVTDEASRLNLNLATEAQLLKLVTAAVGDDTEIEPQPIVDAILDWRDADSIPRGVGAGDRASDGEAGADAGADAAGPGDDGTAADAVGDTEGAYYENLDRPYKVKNGPFDTVEELLLVKGVTRAILYGEDDDQNGLLGDNEDDGDETYPPDNQDGVLNRGLYPYLTVVSYETNVSNDNQPRIYLFGNEATVREQLNEVFEDAPEVVDYIVTASRPSPPGTGGGQAGTGVGQPGTGAGQPGVGAGQPGAGSGQPGGGTGQPGTNTGRGGGGALPGGTGGRGGGDTRRGGGKADPGGINKRGARRQQATGGDEPLDPEDFLRLLEDGGDTDSRDGNTGTDARGDGGTQPGGVAGGGRTAQASARLASPADLLVPDASVSGEPAPIPLKPEHFAALLDRTTVRSPEDPRIRGLININTAPRLVLSCLPGLTEEAIDAIIETRAGLDSETKATPAWLVTEDVLDVTTFAAIAPLITARGQQFRIDALGFADHMGMMVRLEVIVDMIGPVAQTMYYRDLTQLGGHFPIRASDEEKVRAR
ncbi:MAG: hypothetical protein ACE5E6_00510 [Phycisphaerae bacterium]